MFLDLELILNFTSFIYILINFCVFMKRFTNKLLLLLLQISYAEPDSESDAADSDDPADSDAEYDEDLSDAVISDDSDSNNLDSKSSMTKSAKQISNTSNGMCTSYQCQV